MASTTWIWPVDIAALWTTTTPSSNVSAPPRKIISIYRCHRCHYERFPPRWRLSIRLLKTPRKIMSSCRKALKNHKEEVGDERWWSEDYLPSYSWWTILVRHTSTPGIITISVIASPTVNPTPVTVTPALTPMSSSGQKNGVLSSLARWRGKV